MAKTLVLPSNPKDIERIKNAVKEYSDSLVRIEAEKDQMKAIVDLMNEELEVPKNVFKKMAKVYHKQEFDKVTTDASDFEEYYQTIIK
jgi:archaellum component FlaC